MRGASEEEHGDGGDDRAGPDVAQSAHAAHLFKQQPVRGQFPQQRGMGLGNSAVVVGRLSQNARRVERYPRFVPARRETLFSEIIRDLRVKCGQKIEQNFRGHCRKQERLRKNKTPSEILLNFLAIRHKGQLWSLIVPYS